MPSKQKAKITCGIVMPISEIDEKRDQHHFENVQKIIKDAVSQIETYDVACELVSYSDNGGMIHSEIIKNLYHNDIIICDVSGQNPNVFFELGIRLAVDLPTILIQDDESEQIIFDISPLKHEKYPIDLDYQAINQFKVKLANVVEKAYEQRVKEGANFSQYIQNFGGIKVKDMNAQDASVADTLQLVLKQTEMTAHEVSILIQYLSEKSGYKVRRNVEEHRYAERFGMREANYETIFNNNYQYLMTEMCIDSRARVRALYNKIQKVSEYADHNPTWKELSLELTMQETKQLANFIKSITLNNNR